MSAPRDSALSTIAPLIVGAALVAWRLGRWPRPRQQDGQLVLDLLETLENRDLYTANHCFRVAAFADLIAGSLGALATERHRHLRVAALLHDLGKLEVPLDILHKPGALDDLEWEVMRGHVEGGERLAGSLDEEVRRIIAQHHERPDGKGYPKGLCEQQICLEARIVAVADAFDAMTSDRPYRRALDPAIALAELRRCAGLCDEKRGIQFDPAVVEALASRFDEVCALCTPAAAAKASPSA